MPGWLDLRNVPCVVRGSVAVITTIFIIRKIRSRSKRHTSTGPRDVVVLRGTAGRGPYAPSLSPFPLKLELYLKIAKIPYVVDHNAGMSKKNKIPWITYNDEDIADSGFCIEFLNNKFNIGLNSHLTPEQKAIGRAFQSLVEDNLYWIVALNRWAYMDTAERVWLSSPPIPWLLSRWLIPHGVKKQAYAAGMGRHTEGEIWHIGQLNLKAISDFLGKKKYLFGDQISEFDCPVFGMLGQFYWHMPGSPLLAFMKEECPNLVDYLERIKINFWSDWDDYTTCGHTKPALK